MSFTKSSIITGKPAVQLLCAAVGFRCGIENRFSIVSSVAVNIGESTSVEAYKCRRIFMKVYCYLPVERQFSFFELFCSLGEANLISEVAYPLVYLSEPKPTYELIKMRENSYHRCRAGPVHTYRCVQTERNCGYYEFFVMLRGECQFFDIPWRSMRPVRSRNDRYIRTYISVYRILEERIVARSQINFPNVSCLTNVRNPTVLSLVFCSGRNSNWPFEWKPRLGLVRIYIII